MNRGLSVDQRAAQARKPFKGLKRLLSYIKPFKIEMSIVTILILLSTGLSIAGPFLLGVIIDRALVPRDYSELVRWVVVLLGNYLLMWLFGVIYGRIMANTSQKIMRDMRQSLFDHMQKLSIGYYDRQTAGDLLSRLTNDIDAINQLLSQNFISFIQSLGTLIGVLIMMFVLSLTLTMAALTVIPFTFLLTTTIIKRSRPAFQDLQKSLGQLNSQMEEDLSGHRVVIAYGHQGRSLSEFIEYNRATRDFGIRANILAGLMPPVTSLLSNLDVIVVVGVGAYLLIQGIGTVSIGLIATFAEYTRRFGRPLMQIANLFNSVMAALAGAERIFDILDAEPEIFDLPEAISLEAVKGDVRFDDVSFGYLDDVSVLQKINFHAEPGKTSHHRPSSRFH
ncbi:MAG: ABC transporter ATP-binding protein [Brevefilum sp.]